jgi:hypothetical protein
MIMIEASSINVLNACNLNLTNIEASDVIQIFMVVSIVDI